MKAGMVLGIAIGVIALLFGVVIFFVMGAIGGAAGAAGATGLASRGALGAIVSLGLPITAIVGGALAMSQPRASVILLGIPGVAFSLMGLSSLSELWLFLILGLGLILGAFLVNQESTKARQQE